MGKLRQAQLSTILRDRAIFNIFDQEFQKESWLNLSMLTGSECSIDDCYKDGTVPKTVLDKIVDKLEAFEKESEPSE
jgi:hypothetical protein